MAVGDRYTVTQVDNLFGRVRLDEVTSDSQGDAVAQARAALPTQDSAGYTQGGQNPTVQEQSVAGEIGVSGGAAIDQSSLSGLGPQGLSGGVSGPDAFPVVPAAFPAAPSGVGIVNGTR